MIAATLEREAMTETYEDVKDLIFDSAWSFQRSHGGDIEELIAESNKIFVLTYHSYNEDFSKFTYWLVFNIKHGLKEFTKHEWRQSHPSLNRIVKHDPYKCEYAETFSVIELLDEIGKDAETILQLFTETPKEVFTSTLRERIYIKNRIKNRLRQMGWTIRRIKKTLEEISEAILLKGD